MLIIGLVVMYSLGLTWLRHASNQGDHRAYEVWSKHNPEYPMPYEEWLVLKCHRLLPGQQQATK